MGDPLVFEIYIAAGELGTTALSDTLKLWVAMLRPLVVHQPGLRHKLFATAWLWAREGLLSPVHVGQVSFHIHLGS